MSIADALIKDFEAEAKLSRKILEATPEEHFSWQPHEKSWTMAQLAGHVAESPSWLAAMLGKEMDIAQLVGYTAFVPETKAQLMETFETNAAAFTTSLTGKEDAFLQEQWTMRMGKKILTQSPRAEVIREVLIHHTVHHRGQLTVYLRLVDAPVPATYGSTADEQVF